MPPGKYQSAAVVLWHGDWDQPDEPCTTWVTATPPPETVTVSPSHDPDDSAGMDGVATAPGRDGHGRVDLRAGIGHRGDGPVDGPRRSCW